MPDPKVIMVMLAGAAFGAGGFAVGSLIVAGIFANPSEHPLVSLAIPSLCALAGNYYGTSYFMRAA